MDKSDQIDREPSAPAYTGVSTSPVEIFYLLEQFALIKFTDTGEICSETAGFEEEIDLSSSDRRKESLFDLIYEKRGELRMADVIGEDVQRLSGLKPRLRPYQVDAVRWMLSREAQIDKVTPGNEPHPFYIKVENESGQTIYVHKFFAIFTNTMPVKERSMRGGILADEMGLGRIFFFLIFPN